MRARQVSGARRSTAYCRPSHAGSLPTSRSAPSSPNSANAIRSRAALKGPMPGVGRLTIEATELGLWRANDSKLAALVNVGHANPREFAEVTSTADVVAPLANATGGTATRIEDGSGVHVPRLLGVRGDS